MPYVAAADRYESMHYNRCGRSGLKLPAVSLGLWHNFGGVDAYETGRAIVRRAFDRGVTHFDLANNYGPPPGSAEENFGRMLRDDLRPYRDELVISTKAGYLMWPGPYGEWGSRKYLLSSLDQSLQRMGLEYVDIFYSHRPDPDTPFEETMGALESVVRQGKALYVGLSNYSAEQTKPGLRHSRSSRRALPHPSAEVLDVRALGRRRPIGRARRARHRLHSIFAARSGPAHRSLSSRHSRRLPGREAARLPEARAGHGRTHCARFSSLTNWQLAAANRSPRWRSPGCCATRASRRC